MTYVMKAWSGCSDPRIYVTFIETCGDPEKVDHKLTQMWGKGF